MNADQNLLNASAPIQPSQSLEKPLAEQASFDKLPPVTRAIVKTHLEIFARRNARARNRNLILSLIAIAQISVLFLARHLDVFVVAFLVCTLTLEVVIAVLLHPRRGEEQYQARLDELSSSGQ